MHNVWAKPDKYMSYNRTWIQGWEEISLSKHNQRYARVYMYGCERHSDQGYTSIECSVPVLSSGFQISKIIGDNQKKRAFIFFTLC